MRILEYIQKTTKRSSVTRKSIGDSLIYFLKRKKMEDITVTDITNHAGVSRMTYYKYYETKYEVLSDYLYEIMDAYREWRLKKDSESKLFDEIYLKECFLFMIRYQDFFLETMKAGFRSLIIESVNEYMLKYYAEEGIFYKYTIYCYAGAISNAFLIWQKHTRNKAHALS